MFLGFEQTVYQGLVSKNGTYRTINACSRINHWVSSFWQLDVEQGNYIYRSVADNCVDWIINLLDPDESFLVSPFTTPIEFPLTGPVSYFGIRFRTLGYQGLTHLPLGEWNDVQTVKAEEILMPDLLEQIQNCAYAFSQFNQRCDAISKILQASLKYPVIDTRLMQFFRLVNDGSLLSTEAGKLQSIEFGRTQRQVRRLSQLHLGLSMKSFIRVSRFQNVLHLMHMNRFDKQAFLEHFYDQSHFIREFKYFTGTTPDKFGKMSFLYN